MTRVIKFRAWDKEKKEMLYKGDEYNGQAAGGDYYYSSHWDFIAMGIAGATKEDGLHLMQFTGLTDRNGVEIYEGDIVRFQDAHYEIHYTNGCFYGCNELGVEAKYYEVVGNICENSELLK